MDKEGNPGSQVTITMATPETSKIPGILQETMDGYIKSSSNQMSTSSGRSV